MPIVAEGLLDEHELLGLHVRSGVKTKVCSLETFIVLLRYKIKNMGVCSVPIQPHIRRCCEIVNSPAIKHEESAVKPSETTAIDPSSCGCAKSKSAPRHPTVGAIETSEKSIPQMSTRLQATDHLGAVMVRLGIRRDRYRIEPGLYAVGTPDERSDVLVTANYKLTVDSVRKNLTGLNVWLLVLDTKGINVWCAAGKGTFGTDELVNRIKLTSLETVVRHRRLILPQLGAVGVAAHLVKQRSGFTVLYGPVRATDIPAYIQASYKATKEMRLVNFGLVDRAKLIPNDFVYGMRYLLAAAGVLLLLSGITKEGFSIRQALEHSDSTIRNLGLGYCAGIIFTPLFLPLIPTRPFALKGGLIGVFLSALLLFVLRPVTNPGETIAWALMITSVSSFMAMNFTGSSTYTSLSGVKREMKVAVPIQLSSAVLAAILLVLDNII